MLAIEDELSTGKVAISSLANSATSSSASLFLTLKKVALDGRRQPLVEELLEKFLVERHLLVSE